MNATHKLIRFAATAMLFAICACFGLLSAQTP
jgi:hypothetical protein